jgi:hypothetical protein
MRSSATPNTWLVNDRWRSTCCTRVYGTTRWWRVISPSSTTSSVGPTVYVRAHHVPTSYADRATPTPAAKKMAPGESSLDHSSEKRNTAALTTPDTPMAATVRTLVRRGPSTVATSDGIVDAGPLQQLVPETVGVGHPEARDRRIGGGGGRPQDQAGHAEQPLERPALEVDLLDAVVRHQ